MKPRYTNNFSRAVSTIRGELSEATCAEAVGRSASLIRKWADPDNSAIPNLEQALALDLLYARQTGRKPPILERYTEKMTDTLNGRRKLTVNLLIATLSVQGVVGQLSEIVAQLSESGSDQTPSLSNYNRASILQLVDRLQELSDLIEDSLELESTEGVP